MSKGAIQPDPIVIGEVSAPPFAVLPDPTRLFVDRALRLRALAGRSEIGPYLRFVSDLAELQYRIQDGLPEPDMPEVEALSRARFHAMPPLDRTGFTTDAALEATLAALFDAAGGIAKPAAARQALARVSGADAAEREGMLRAVLAASVPAGALAEHVYVAAALQVH